ncbi:MAG: lactate utilization protein [Opitutales bacterium]|nr:lactate utilization protein [Opitutales bacterium]MBP3357832.1 lactate utilization protein [Opitutales bacterium]
MAIQPIDKFCETLDPIVKNAVTIASIGSTIGREKTLAEAYPEENKAEHLRNLANQIRAIKPSENFEKAVNSLEKNGIKVLFASDAEEAQELILKIIKEKNAKNVVKVKSMTTEEIELNHFLEKNGIEAVETDLGELIIQIDNERPSHIVKPAIHRRRDDIARSFEKHKIAPYDEEPTHITLNARKYLRRKYFGADVVISGANYVLAEEGAIVLATNEGNSRFSMAGAKTHIAIAGFEKVIPSSRELSVFLNLLGRSATGQHSTVYTDFVRGAGSAKNSPEEMYVIFLDNGRSKILGSEFAEILKCMRCGACMNRCPVFRLVGGHAYRAVYPGPLGIVLSPLLAKDIAEYADLPKACTLCGGCAEVCPAKIPLPDLILKMRDKVKKENAKVANDINFKAWAILASSPKLWRLAMPFNRLANLVPLNLFKVGPLGRWLKTRTLPKFNGGKFRKWFSKNG